MELVDKGAKRRLAAGLIGVAAISTGGWLGWKFFVPESLESIADCCVGCLSAGDGPCVYRLMEEKEKKIQGVTPESLTSLLANYALPAAAGRTGAPVKEVRSSKEYATVTVTSIWQRPAQTPIEFGACVAATPEGGRATNVVRDIIFGAFDAKYRKSQGEPTQLVNLEGMIRDGKRLSAMGFTGICIPTEDRIETWDQLIAESKANAVKIGLLDPTKTFP